MPTYIVYHAENAFTAAEKKSLAKNIINAHTSVTGAQRLFGQVMFRELKSEDWYLAGEEIDRPFVFLFAYVRAGRDVESKHELIRELNKVLVEAASVVPERAWVSLSEIPAENLMEYGQILPNPGHESEWLAGLPQAIKEAIFANSGEVIN
ncbi:TPA: tautomerase family protein [Pseudomonas aeruginosa]|uniref:Tautomerase cis-CaaD-like domain-containing protein n=1 Tax=Pseudomonas monteilii TaxID=76759 RepID=A0A399M7F8_9PSED|nr:tautomerase family protein [Pseudomonas monteilii]RII76826.1 hypothetical protein D0894_15435 [Pseudomonas monteilii]HCF7274953.1 tautomerase family protein [Pseudomonas aeruginosa]